MRRARRPRFGLAIAAGVLAVFLLRPGPEPDFLDDGERTEPTPRPLRSDLFGQLDRDGDGYVSQREAQQQSDLAVRFVGIDADGDGQIGHAEFRDFEAIRPQRVQPDPDASNPEP